MAWGGNSDWQFVGDFSMVLDRYITGYISKAEKNSKSTKKTILIITGIR